MPRPRNERQALEEELAELPAQIAAYQRELHATTPENKARREMREWQIRRDRRRLAEVSARLVAMQAESPWPERSRPASDWKTSRAQLSSESVRLTASVTRCRDGW